MSENWKVTPTVNFEFIGKVPTYPTPHKVPLVCAQCGCETNVSMTALCQECGSCRVVLQSVVEDLFGANWRDFFRKGKIP
jgi:hypothetical protein